MGTSQPTCNSNYPTPFSHSVSRTTQSDSNIPFEENLLTFGSRSEFLSQLSIFQKRLKASGGQCGCIVSVLEVNSIGKEKNTGQSLCKQIKETCIEGQFMMMVKVEQLIWKVSQLGREIDVQSGWGIKNEKRKGLSFMEGLYLLNGGLYGFAELRNAFKREIRICEGMIGISYQGNVKVWVNRDFFINQVEGYQQISNEKVLKNYYPTSKQSHIPDLVTSLFNVLQPHCKELAVFRDKFERQYKRFTYYMQLQELQEKRISFAKSFTQKYIQSDKEIQRLFVANVIRNGLVMRFCENDRRSRPKSKQLSGSYVFREKSLSLKKSLKRSQTSHHSQQRSPIFSKKNSQKIGNQILPYIMTQYKQSHSLSNRCLGRHLSSEREHFKTDKNNCSKGNITDRKRTGQHLSQSIVNQVCRIQSVNKLNSSRSINQTPIRSLDQSPILSSKVSKNHTKSVSNQRIHKVSSGITLTPNTILTKRYIQNKLQPQLPKPPKKSPISALHFDRNQTVLRTVSYPPLPIEPIQPKMLVSRQVKIIRYERPAPETFERRGNAFIKSREGERRKVSEIRNSENSQLQRVKGSEILPGSQENSDGNFLHYISKKPEDVGFLQGQLEWSTSPKPRKIIILGKQAAAMNEKVLTSRQTTVSNGYQNLAPRPVLSSRRDTPVPHKSQPFSQRSIPHSRGRQIIPLFFGQRHSQFSKVGFYNRNINNNGKRLENVVESRINEESTCEGFRQTKMNTLLRGLIGQGMQEREIETSYVAEEGAQSRHKEHRRQNDNADKVQQGYNQNSRQTDNNVDIQCLALQLKNVLQDKPCLQQSRQVPSEQSRCRQNFQQKKDNGSLRLRLLEVRQIHSCAEDEAKQIEKGKENRSANGNSELGMGLKSDNFSPSGVSYNFSPSEPESTIKKIPPLQKHNTNIKMDNVNRLTLDLKQKLHMGKKQSSKIGYHISQQSQALQSSESSNLMLDQALKNRQVLKSYYDFELGQGGRCYHSRSVSGGMSISGEIIGRQKSCQGPETTGYILEHPNFKAQSGRTIQDRLKSSIRKDKMTAIRFKSAISEGMKEQGWQEISYAIFTQRNGVQRMMINQ